MKTHIVQISFITFLLITSNLFSQSNTNAVKDFDFTIPPRGEKVFEIQVPKGAKTIKAVISGQTEMLSMEILGPTDVVLSKNTTWSNLSNWKKPLSCSSGVINNDRQKPGIWKVKIKGAVHTNKVDKIKSISGSLKVYISGDFKDNPLKTLELPITKTYSFTIPPRGEKVFEIQVPKGAKTIKAVISEQTEMLNMEILGPTNVVLSKNTTWSNLSNWKKPLNCSSGVVNNDRQKPGTWKIKIKGAVHTNKVDKIKSISGKLKIVISD